VAFETDTRTRHSVYPLWLRFFTLIAVLAAAFIMLGPSYLLSNINPSLPWNEEQRILPSGRKPSFRLSPDHPKLTDNLRYQTLVQHEDNPRGNLNFVVLPDGIVKGIWSGEYDEYDDVHCVVLAASFFGNIDPSKPCIEGNRHDASKLYFVTAGTYTLLKEISSGPSRGINGLVYVRGWLDPNYAAIGELILTKDKRSYETYSWTAQPVK
jgi:hypothetical protein